MSRTTENDVKAFLGNNYDTRNSPSLAPFIDIATTLVDNMVSCAGSSYSFSDAVLEKIERLLACHLYGFQDQFLSHKRTQDASGSFQGATGLGLKSSFYGQTAMQLDPSGCLANSDQGVVNVSLDWLGKVNTEKLSYGQRNGYGSY